MTEDVLKKVLAASIGDKINKTAQSDELMKMIKTGNNPAKVENDDTVQLATIKGETNISNNLIQHHDEEDKPDSDDSIDDMTISGLSAIIRRAHQDKASLALGLDGDLLLGEEFNSFLSSSADIEESGSNFETKRRRRLCSLIASPWAPISFDHDVIDSATHSSPNHNRFTGVDNILPSCYNVQSPPPAALRVASFCEETLFYMFYGMPRDRMQELAAKELTLSRGWRFHLFLELWFQPSTILPPGVPLAPPSSMMISPARTVENGNFSDNSIDGEQSGISMTENFSNLAISGANSHSQNPDTEKPNDICSYVIFDSNNWCKLRKDLPRIQDDQIESRFSTAPVGTAAFC